MPLPTQAQRDGLEISGHGPFHRHAQQTENNGWEFSSAHGRLSVACFVFRVLGEICFDCSDFRAAAVNMTCLNVSSGQMLATMQLTNSAKTDYPPSSSSPFLGLTDKSLILENLRQLWVSLICT